MKAISPMIAVVLLIAFVVAIGGLVAVWFSTLTGTQTGTVQSGVTSLTKCATSTLTLSAVRFPAGATSNVTQALLNITVVAGGTEPLKNLTFSIAAKGSSQASIKYFNATGDDLLPGLTFSASVNVTNNVTLPPETVTSSAICQSVIAVSDECKTGEPCMKPV